MYGTKMSASTVCLTIALAISVTQGTFVPHIPFIPSVARPMHPPVHIAHFPPMYHGSLPPLTPLHPLHALLPGAPHLFSRMGVGAFLKAPKMKRDNMGKAVEQMIPGSRKINVSPGKDLPVKKTVADRVLCDMDLKVDPCVDFYQYTCGGFIRNTPVPGGISTKFLEPNAVLCGVLTAALGERPLPSDATPFLKAKALYRSCMNEDMIAYRGTLELRNLISYLGGWPVLGKWNSRLFYLEETLARSRPYLGAKHTALIGVTVELDIMRFGRFTLFVDQPRLGQPHLIGPDLTPDIYLVPRDSVYPLAYQQYIADIATDLGAKMIVAEKDAKEIVNFEIELAKIMLPQEEHRRAALRYKKVSLYQMYLRYPQFNWLRYLRRIAQPSGVFISDKASLVLWDDHYYDKLFKLLKKVPTRTVANYITWRTIQPLLASQGRQFQLRRLKMEALLNGATNATLTPRDQYCAEIVNEQMPWVTGRIYVDRHLGKQKLNAVKEISAYTKYALMKTVQGTKWMSEKTKFEAIRKIQATSEEIGFPAYIMDNAFLHMYYKQFQMKEYSFFWSLKNSLVQNYIQSFRQLVFPHPGRWRNSPAKVRGMYIYNRNAIELGAGVMEEPLYSKDYPQSMNFGAIGVCFGNLMSHAIDLTGLSYNAGGVLEDTWSKPSIGILRKKVQCYTDQFSQPFMPKEDYLFASATKTADENTADTIGIKVAYLAYKLWTSQRKVVDQVPGLPFTGDQLYFISLGRWMCEKMSPEAAGRWQLTDVFSLFRHRVLIQLQNSPEFSQAFKCPVGSPMNPVAKCQLL